MTLLRPALAGVVALGCLLTTTSAVAVTLDVLYCNPSFSRFHEPIAEAFMAAEPTIEIAFRAPCASYDEGHQSLLRAAVTGQMPDVYYSGFHLLEELAQTLAARQQIVDLGPLIEAEGKAYVEDNFAPSMMTLGRVDGTQYGLAFNASTPIIYVNRDLVRRAGGDPDAMPADWDALIELAAAVDALDPEINGMAYDVHSWPDSWLFQAMIFQQGGTLLDDARKQVAFDNEIGLRAMTLFRRFVSEGGNEVIDRDQAIQQFAAGQIGFTFQTPARLQSIGQMVGETFDLGTATFPLDNPTEGGIPTGGNAVVILTDDPEKQAAAWDFVKYVTGPEAQTVVVETTGYLPTNKRALGPDYLEPFYAANPDFRTAADQIDRALPWVGYPGGQSVRIWRTQRDTIGEVMRGQKTPEEGLAEIVASTEQLIE